MIIGLYLREPLLSETLYWKLFNDKDMKTIEDPHSCLCSHEDLSGLDAVVVHPEYDDKYGCWTRILGLVRKHPETDFYLFAINSSEREIFFGQHPNLEYINSLNIDRFLDNPAGYMKKE